MSATMPLAPGATSIAQREAQDLLDQVEGVNTVVVATVDGFDVASALRTGEAARVAAMASSISAISAVVSQEARLGGCRTWESSAANCPQRPIFHRLFAQ